MQNITKTLASLSAAEMKVLDMKALGMQVSKTQVAEMQMPEHQAFRMTPELRDILVSMRDGLVPAAWGLPDPEDEHYSEKRDILDNLERYEEDVTPLVRILFTDVYNACVAQRDYCEMELRTRIPRTDAADRLYKGAVDAEIALLYIYTVDVEDMMILFSD